MTTKTDILNRASTLLSELGAILGELRGGAADDELIPSLTAKDSEEIDPQTRLAREFEKVIRERRLAMLSGKR